MSLFRILIFLYIALLVGACSSKKASVQNAENKTYQENLALDYGDAEFVITMLDERLLNLEAGKLASRKGTTVAIRNYGDRMVRDQAQLLEELQMLARQEGVELPKGLTHKKEKELQELQALKGKAFDQKFVSRMREDQMNGYEKFTAASKDAKNTNIRSFAVEKLPLIHDHFEKAKKLR